MKKLNKNEEIILDYISKKNEIAISELVEDTSIQKRTAQRALKSLTELKLIEALGTTKNRIYRRVFNTDDISEKLIVFSSGVMVGELHYGTGEYTFEYDDKYKGEELEGLKKGVISSSAELFTYFENLIPEYERRDRLLGDKEDIAWVLEGLKNAHGALDFIPKYKLFEYKPNYGKRENWISVKNKILSENKFPNLIVADIQIDDDILDATSNTEHSDLSGYQTKVDIDIDFEKKVIVESNSAEYILKPRNKNKSNYFNVDEDGKKRHYPYIAINEHLFMSFAKNELGFDVPYSGIIKAKDRDYHYITKRFDRIGGLKYNQVDFAQILGVKSADKYKSSSEELFEALNKKLSSNEAKLEAIRFYYYSYLIKHADLHLKNIGAFEIGMKKYILTPLYDLISVGIYNGDSWDLGLGMKTPYKKPKNWKLDEFYKLAKILNISQLRFKKEAREITEIFIKKMPKYIKMLEEFETQHPLPMQKTRANSNIDFSTRVKNIFQERIIRLKKLGIIEELELVEVAGGLLAVQK
ncbi:type II toxin-antitoxin system HipA family toxin [Candidatus Sulfurimonas baltica]|uniref:Type II toxin-antitoxin system HipA family toxin n=1 Tax=Candidatus Sulfurimonas baltica TaxID=2740404 RepID=A0A7S7RMS0_9BACT|nr:type II toxin-antitoxin system HipA family toxin [Candidatus Sulfurimonas baltica]QOY51746.1 type II toxin-antitoxin system HipA family toxin [Candidatus Sulfurimonas baltica]